MQIVKLRFCVFVCEDGEYFPKSLKIFCLAKNASVLETYAQFLPVISSLFKAC